MGVVCLLSAMVATIFCNKDIICLYLKWYSITWILILKFYLKYKKQNKEWYNTLKKNIDIERFFVLGWMYWPRNLHGIIIYSNKKK